MPRGTEAGDNETDRKRWITPKLRIFARSRAEEMVLAGCKYDGSSGPTTSNIKCRLACTSECSRQSNT